MNVKGGVYIKKEEEEILNQIQHEKIEKMNNLYWKSSERESGCMNYLEIFFKCFELRQWRDLILYKYFYTLIIYRR